MFNTTTKATHKNFGFISNLMNFEGYWDNSNKSQYLKEPKEPKEPILAFHIFKITIQIIP